MMVCVGVLTVGMAGCGKDNAGGGSKETYEKSEESSTSEEGNSEAAEELDYDVELVIDSKNKYEIGYTDLTEDFEIPEVYDNLKGTRYKIVGIADGAFSEESGEYHLKSVSIPETVTKIGASAFADCCELEKVTLSPGLKEIGNEAFMCCGLKEINLPEGLEKIGDMAFCDYDFKEIHIPASVTKIGNEAFDPKFDPESGATIYCDFTEAYAKEHFDENWVLDWVLDEGICKIVYQK